MVVEPNVGQFSQINAADPAADIIQQIFAILPSSFTSAAETEIVLQSGDHVQTSPEPDDGQVPTLLDGPVEQTSLDLEASQSE